MLKAKKKSLKKVQEKVNINSTTVQQNIVLVAIITIVVSIIAGYMFLRKNYSDGALFLAIGLALLSSLVDLNRLPRMIRFIVYGLSVVPAILLLVIILRDFT